MEFTLTPQGTNAFEFQSILYDKQSYSGLGATLASVRSSVDGYASDIDEVAVNPSGSEQITFDLSSLPPVPTPITFRIYFYAAPVHLADRDDLVSSALMAKGLRVTGTLVATVAVEDPDARLPQAFDLMAATPSPFASTTRIDFALPRPSPVRLDVYDMAGRRVRTLAASAYAAGRHQVEWDGADDRGRRLGPGVYLYRLHAGVFQAKRRIVLIR